MTRALALALLLLAPAALADPLPAAEREKIVALIASVEHLQDAVFVRNGKAYGPATAAKFLRGKWEDRAAQIRSAEDFIAKVATRSSTTGKPYLVRYKDGREVATEVFLRDALRRM
jgi:membrane-bound lytic murein transglycosylase